MADRFAIRPSEAADRDALARLYPAAFPDEDLWPLVDQLLELGDSVLSLVAVGGEELLGHVLFTRCTVEDGGEPASLLGPAAVAPAAQRRGAGGALIGEGLKRLKDKGVRQVCVLGDPGYYCRFGFVRADDVSPPYPLPDTWREAWQSIDLSAAAAPIRGRLSVPAPWRDPALWLP